MATTTTRIFKTVIVEPGESFTLPPDAEIIFTSNNTGLTSDCSVPDTEEYVCYRFTFGYSDTGGDDAALEDEGTPHPTINYLEIAGNQYSIEYDLNGSQIIPMVTAIEAAVDSTIFNIYSVIKNNFDRRVEYGIKFKTFPSLVEGLVMKITGVSYTDGLYLIPVEEDNCDCYGDGDDNYCTLT